MIRTKLHIAALPLVLMLLSAASAAKAQTVTLDEISYDTGFGTIRVPRVEVDASTLTRDELRALFDMREIATLGTRMGRLDAQAVRIPEITFEWRTPTSQGAQAAGVGRIAVRLFDLSLSGITSGRVRTASLAGGKMSFDTAAGPISSDMRRMIITDLDIAHLVRIYGDKARPDEMQPRLIYGSATLDGMGLTAPQFSMTVGRVSARDYKGRPLKAGFSGYFTTMQKIGETSGGPGARPGPGSAKAAPDPALMAEMFAQVADMYAAFETGPADMADLRLKGTNDKGKAFDISLARLAFDGMARGRLGRWSMDDASISAPDGFVRIANITVKPLDLSSMIAAFGEIGARPIDQWVQIDNNARRLIPEFGGFAMRDLAVDVPDEKNPSQRINFKVGSFDLSLANYVIGIPTDIGLRADRVVAQLPTGSNDDVVRALLAKGQTSVEFSAGFGLRWEEATQSLRLVDTRISGVGFGEARLDGTFGNVTRQLLTAAPQAVPMLALSVTGRTARISLRNGGLVELLADIHARKQGRAPAELIREFVEMATQSLKMALASSPPVAEQLAAAIKAFADSPRSLVIELRATNPNGIGAAELALIAANPAAALSVVAVTARANAD